MPVSRRVARFNRTVANHFVGPVLKRLPGFGEIHHRGRSSGRRYRTPVKVFRRGDDYVITLPYGPSADWVKNVLAAGECRLRTRGRVIQLAEPRLFEDDGQATVPAFTRFVMSRIKSTRYLALTPVRK
jgi:deazaflavin-dependent oxidoreductase (nitroreductase family)